MKEGNIVGRVQGVSFFNEKAGKKKTGKIPKLIIFAGRNSEAGFEENILINEGEMGVLLT